MSLTGLGLGRTRLGFAELVGLSIF